MLGNTSGTCCDTRPAAGVLVVVLWGWGRAVRVEGCRMEGGGVMPRGTMGGWVGCGCKLFTEKYSDQPGEDPWIS